MERPCDTRRREGLPFACGTPFRMSWSVFRFWSSAVQVTQMKVGVRSGCTMKRSAVATLASNRTLQVVYNYVST